MREHKQIDTPRNQLMQMYRIREAIIITTETASNNLTAYAYKTIACMNLWEN